MTTIHNHLLPLSMWTVEDSNVLMKLKLKRENAKPTPTSIRQNLGPRLAEAVFSNVCPYTKSVIGIGKELDGPGDDLASQPQRQLHGELILEPFPSRRRRQALTHQAIIDYGEKCMEKWEKLVSGQQEALMLGKLKVMTGNMEEFMEAKINQIKKKEREDFLIRIAMMEDRLEDRHKKEMDALTRKLMDEKDAKVAEVIATMNDSHQHETDVLLNTSKKLLNSQYQFKINWIKSDLEEDYSNKINERTKIIEETVTQKYESKESESLAASKNQMLQSVLCTACLTADFLLKEFKQRIDLLKKELIELCEINNKLEEQIKMFEEKNKICNIETQAWECMAKDIVEQFQRFIAFQLTLPLNECDHMISWEKILKQKNYLFDKLVDKYNAEIYTRQTDKQHEDEQIFIQHVKPEDKDEESFSGICENKVIISIISSIIHQVIPSDPKLTESQQEINSILESIIRKAIPSSSFLFEDVVKSETFDIRKNLCPKFLRTGLTSEETFNKETSDLDNDISNNVISKTLEQDLKNRLEEITKVMNLYPNILKFIQGS